MTNHWVDLQNCKTILVEGSNVAENHPMAFKWIRKAQENGAKIIHVDPRYTRTSSAADVYARIRPGTDAAFQNTMINHILVNKLYDEDYVVTHTNALFLGDEAFDFKDGVFSGFDPETHKYDTKTWGYQLDAKGKPRVATSLDDPHCVFSRLKTFVSRYTLETGERITGIPKDQFLKAADLFTSVRKDGDMKKAATIIYAVGWTQHTFGTQIIRTAAILQLLLGNVGRAGGGVNALRGHSNIQGATDMGGVFDIFPGYLKIPQPADTDLATFLKRTTPAPSKPNEWDSYNYWSNTPKFMVSFLKAMYGDSAKKENDFNYQHLPKIDRKFSWTEMWDEMYAGKVKGLFAFGMNGVAIGPNSRKNIEALKKADFLVVCDLYPEETAEFWRAPGTTPEQMKNINTTVYSLPGAGFAEKDGTFVNSARWLQWKYVALPPPGEAKVDQEILARIFLKVRELYQKEGGKFPDPIFNLSWSYTTPESPSLSEVAKEINGRALADLTDPAQPGVTINPRVPTSRMVLLTCSLISGAET